MKIIYQVWVIAPKSCKNTVKSIKTNRQGTFRPRGFEIKGKAFGQVTYH